MISHALIFAAGRGERMRPLSDATPKPLLHAGGKSLIEWQIERLAESGVRRIVINTSHLAEQIPIALGDGARWNVHIAYSYEGPEPLETGGGMLRALPLLGTAPFIAVNADIWTDFPFSTLPQNPTGLAHLVLVDNPKQHALGDFVLDGGLVRDPPDADAEGIRLTFAGIGVYRPELLRDQTPRKFSMVPLLRLAMHEGRVTGQHHRGRWTDVGTPQRLADLENALAV